MPFDARLVGDSKAARGLCPSPVRKGHDVKHYHGCRGGGEPGCSTYPAAAASRDQSRCVWGREGSRPTLQLCGDGQQPHNHLPPQPASGRATFRASGRPSAQRPETQRTRRRAHRRARTPQPHKHEGGQCSDTQCVLDLSFLPSPGTRDPNQRAVCRAAAGLGPWSVHAASAVRGPAPAVFLFGWGCAVRMRVPGTQVRGDMTPACRKGCCGADAARRLRDAHYRWCT